MMSSSESEAVHSQPEPKPDYPYRYWIALGVVLLGIWLLWSGHSEPLMIGFGVLSCALVVWISVRMRIVDEEGEPLQLGLKPCLYLVWLLKEIIQANIDVAWRVLSPRLPIRPQMIRIKSSQETDLGRVIFANSITLTPGTVSVDMVDDDIVVHALTDEAAAEDAAGEMNRRVTELEKR
jgi:multicomponent Na+:H+ antiporter subunit E